MKKYFVKYLPVEGEIKEEGKAFFSNGTLVEWQKGIGAELIKSLNLSIIKSAKLFLCSRDIGIGDKFYRKYTKAVGHTPEMECIGMDTTGTVLYSEGINDDIYNPKDLCFKIIGEISPDAVWVKEGDEFDRDDIMYTVSDVDEPDEYRGCGSNFFKSTSLPKRIGIKCPTCKKFH